MTSKLSVYVASTAIAAMLATPAALNAAASAAPWCTPEMLSVSTGPYGSPGDASQMHFDVILTNISPGSCTSQGYPGLDLVGPDDPTFGPTYSLPRQDADPQPVTISPGASAVSRLTFLPTPGGWVPDTIVVTPPDATSPLEVPWIPGGIGVLRQDAATHPGTYIGPLQTPT